MLGRGHLHQRSHLQKKTEGYKKNLQTSIKLKGQALEMSWLGVVSFLVCPIFYWELELSWLGVDTFVSIKLLRCLYAYVRSW